MSYPSTADPSACVERGCEREVVYIKREVVYIKVCVCFTVYLL